VVLDARPDERFFAEPLVAAAPKIRFFAGVRLYGAGGRTLGALYVMSPQNRRSFSKENQAKLKVLAWLVSRKLELRRVLLEEREQAERAAAVAVPGKQVTTSNVNAEFLELMAKVASGDLPDEEVMAISMKAWNERVRSSVLLGACLRSLRRTMSTKQYETFTAKMDGFSL
jgi:hypothetical protein